MSSPSRIALRAMSLLPILAILTGCSHSDRPDLGEVEGIVTLDGAPLANAKVVFRPGGVRQSWGRTDEQGHYRLFYLRDITGAAVGEHTVSITAATEQDPQERIPAVYNSQSRLIREVKLGSNRIDFQLQSEPDDSSAY